MKNFKIGEWGISEHSRCLLVAELSANHNQDRQLAIETIKAAKESGADAIKFQTYTPDTITIDSEKDYFKLKHGTIWDGATYYKLYQKAYTPWEWHEELFEVAIKTGLICFSSPFDHTAVDLLDSLNTPCYKISSFEITDIPLVKYAASKMKPMIISTGIATEEDIWLAIETCRQAGNDDIILLKCTSSYPAPIEEANMRVMQDFGDRFDVFYGLSDHTEGSLVPTVASSLGAKIIEKHFILDRKAGGPDASFSMEPSDFNEMVKSVRSAEVALGSINYELTEKSKVNRMHSRSLFVVQDVKKGEKLSSENIRSIRPGYGMHPKYYENVMGKMAAKDLTRGEPLKEEDVA